MTETMVASDAALNANDSLCVDDSAVVAVSKFPLVSGSITVKSFGEGEFIIDGGALDMLWPLHCALNCALLCL